MNTKADIHEMRTTLRGPSAPLAAIVTWPQDGARDQGVLICSPSPLLGGDMENNVTQALARAIAIAGFPALRFDYRNAGKSGDATGGLPRAQWWHEREESGDLDCAVDDAVTALAGAVPFFSPQAVVGYSFGGWVAAELAAKNTVSVRGLAAVCPPLGRLDFAALAHRSPAPLIVVATGDELDAPPAAQALRERFPDACVDVLENATHFLLGEEERATDAVCEYLRGALA